MALVGLSRLSTKGRDPARQHETLDPICVKVFDQKVSGKLSVDERPGLRAAPNYLRDGDMLTAQEVDCLGRNLLEDLIVPTELFERGIAVKVLAGIAAEVHTERSLILDLALAPTEGPVETSAARQRTASTPRARVAASVGARESSTTRSGP